jgi:hypothetical protein
MLQNEFNVIRLFSYMGPTFPALQIKCHTFSQRQLFLEKATHVLVTFEVFFDIVNIILNYLLTYLLTYSMEQSPS